jgi:energy-coupling factor transporter ATP-binding protein EcfA2
MIEVSNLTYAYRDAAEPALTDVHLSVARGTVTLIVGATGSGKSTLLYSLNGLIPHVFGGKFSGSVRVDGLSPQETPIRELSKTVGTVFQNPDTQIFMLRVEDDVAFGCENLMLPLEEIVSRRDDALKSMGLWEARRKETFKLSGGQKQRLAIAAIYAMGPQVFLFDEPMADLDLQGRRAFIEILKTLKAQGKTILVAEHQYEDLLPLADRVVTLEKGGVVPGRRVPPSIGASPGGMEASRVRVMELQGVGFAYETGRPVLQDIHMTVQQGEMIALCGPNGSGKSSLLKVLAGILKPQAGQVTVLNHVAPDLEALIGRVGFLFQNPDEQLFADSVAAEVAFGPGQLGRVVDASAWLNTAGFDPLKERHPQTLSHGQRRLLAVVAVLAMEPEILILDEPTTGLDDANWRRLMEVLRASAARGKSVVFTTHHPRAGDWADRVLVMKEGRMVSDALSR